MSRCHCRCRHCDTRRVLPRDPRLMKRPPVCGGCGRRDWRPDKWMNERDTSLRGMGCNCGGYPWAYGSVHRKGSPFCWRRKDGSDRLPGDADFKDVRSEAIELMTAIDDGWRCEEPLPF